VYFIISAIGNLINNEFLFIKKESDVTSSVLQVIQQLRAVVLVVMMLLSLRYILCDDLWDACRFFASFIMDCDGSNLMDRFSPAKTLRVRF